MSAKQVGKPEVQPIQGPERHAYDIGAVDEFPPGSRKILDVGKRSVAVYNSGDALYAVQNICPHALAPIGRGALSGTMLPSTYGDFEWGMEGLVLRCIWHGWEFDVRTGETVCGTDRRRLVTFPITVEDGRIIVTLRPRRSNDTAAVSGEQLQ
jgi:nitrite reductase (NADH) small subunit